MEQTGSFGLPLAALGYLHGLFNLSVALLFLYQASLGLKIRGGRFGRRQPDHGPARRHRRIGPLLAGLGLLGFLAGAFIVSLKAGGILLHPPHFLNGMAIAFLIAFLFVSSRAIRGAASPWRVRHAAAGALLLALYTLQVLSGAALIWGS